MTEKRLKQIISESIKRTVNEKCNNMSAIPSVIEKIRNNTMELEFVIDDCLNSEFGNSLDNFFSKRISEINELLDEIENGYKHATGHEW